MDSYSEDRQKRTVAWMIDSLSTTHVDEPILGRDATNKPGLKDEEAAYIISCSPKGLRTVKVNHSAKVHTCLKSTLVRHLPMLEAFVVTGCDGVTGEDLVRVLSSCPNTHTLIAIDDEKYKNNAFHHIRFSAFIHWDPFASSFNHAEDQDHGHPKARCR